MDGGDEICSCKSSALKIMHVLESRELPGIGGSQWKARENLAARVDDKVQGPT